MGWAYIDDRVVSLLERVEDLNYVKNHAGGCQLINGEWVTKKKINKWWMNATYYFLFDFSFYFSKCKRMSCEDIDWSQFLGIFRGWLIISIRASTPVFFILPLPFFFLANEWYHFAKKINGKGATPMYAILSFSFFSLSQLKWQLYHIFFSNLANKMAFAIFDKLSSLCVWGGRHYFELEIAFFFKKKI